MLTAPYALQRPVFMTAAAFEAIWIWNSRLSRNPYMAPH